MTCGHARVQRFELETHADLVCLDCDHTWAEYPGELVFAQGQPSLTAALLCTPRDERTIPTSGDERCAYCGHFCEAHDLLGGCVYHDSDGPCVCAGFRSN